MEQRIDFNKSEKYQLLIRMQSPNDASFYVYDDAFPNAGHYEILKLSRLSLFIESLKEAIFNNGHLSLNYKNTQILLSNGFYTFVPEDIYKTNEDKKETFFKFNFENIENSKILSNRIEMCNIVNLFGVQKDLYDFLQRTFPFAGFTHHVTPLLQYFLRQRIMGEKERMCVYVYENELSIFCFRNATIEAVNTFPCTNINDAAYFILSLWDKLHFNQLSDGLYVAGSSNEKAELLNIISRFIQNVVPVNNPIHGENHLKVPFDVQAYLHL